MNAESYLKSLQSREKNTLNTCDKIQTRFADLDNILLLDMVQFKASANNIL